MCIGIRSPVAAKARVAIGCNCDERVPERPDATQIPETHPSGRRRTCVISNSRSRGARIQMGRNERSARGGAQKCTGAAERRRRRRRGMGEAGGKITMLPYGRTWNCRITRRREKRRRSRSGGERETGTEWNSRRRRTERGKEYVRATWCVRGVGGDCPTKPYGQNYHTHTYVRPYRSEERGLI